MTKARDYEDLSALSGPDRRARWAEIQRDDPALAALLGEPELAALRAGFADGGGPAGHVLIPGPTVRVVTPAQGPRGVALTDRQQTLLGLVPEHWTLSNQIPGSIEELCYLERLGRIAGRLNRQSELEFSRSGTEQ